MTLGSSVGPPVRAGVAVSAAFAEAIDRLIAQVHHRTPQFWAASGASGEGSRAQLVHRLVQLLADLEASATGREALPVPRLDNDLALPDQLRVVGRDLLAAATDPGAALGRDVAAAAVGRGAADAPAPPDAAVVPAARDVAAVPPAGDFLATALAAVRETAAALQRPLI